MQIRYFYELDCFDLNRKPHLYYPLIYRAADFLDKILPVDLGHKKNETIRENSELIQGLLNKVKTTEKKIDWQQNLKEATYVVFDTETTGLQPFRGDKIISIGGVVIENGAIKYEQTFNRLVNPDRKIPPTATYITGITNEMVADKEGVYPVLNDFLDFIGDRILVAHNAAFDLAFLNISLCHLAPARICNPVIDTYILSKYLLPDMIEHSLESLLYHFEIDCPDSERHTALGDSIMTAKLFHNLLRIIIEEKKIVTLNDLHHFLIMMKDSAYTLRPPEGH